MTEMMHLSFSADWFAGIKASEGLQLVGYLDGANVPTAGNGHTKDVEVGKVYTVAETEKWLKDDGEEALIAIMRLFPNVPFAQHQIDALGMFIFNFGETKAKGYTLTQLINDGSPQQQIIEKWLEYIYTVADPDGDGVVDAIIDRGLPIRRYREVLLWLGFSWQVCEGAANANNLDLSEHRIPWRGGYKEVLSNPTPIEDVIARARSLTEIFEEPQPDKALFDDPELEIPTRGADPKPSEAKDPTPETPMTMNDVQFVSAQAGGFNGTYADFMTHRTVVTERNAIKAPNVDLREPPKAVEDSETGRGFAKQVAGRENLNAGAILSGVSTAVATAKALTNDATSTAENTRALVGGFTLDHLIIVGLVFGIPLVIYGAWKMFRGEEIAKNGRANATQLKV